MRCLTLSAALAKAGWHVGFAVNDQALAVVPSLAGAIEDILVLERGRRGVRPDGTLARRGDAAGRGSLRARHGVRTTLPAMGGGDHGDRRSRQPASSCRCAAGSDPRPFRVRLPPPDRPGVQTPAGPPASPCCGRSSGQQRRRALARRERAVSGTAAAGVVWRGGLGRRHDCWHFRPWPKHARRCPAMSSSARPRATGRKFAGWPPRYRPQ